MKQKPIASAILVACILAMPAVQAQDKGAFNFRYRVSDSRVNIFDDGSNTRLQLPEGTLIPAVISIKTNGQSIIDLKRDGSYLVIPGVHQTLKLIWANGREINVVYAGESTPERMGGAAAYGTVTPIQQYASAQRPAAVSQQPDSGQQRATENAWAAAGRVPQFAQHVETVQASAVQAPLPGQYGTPVTTAAPVVPPFKLQAPETVRTALDRWSKSAGWAFGPEHYTVSFDIPVLANDENLGTDFKTAVRLLLDSTALTDAPIQPCFYSNKVLRVVLRSERCDRL
ncbi:hypothetical protein B9Z51_06840 [Limnohabitans sp. T6-5]|uniref:TcpQ domain-containing protein n=1 Tax=Limnohabitans sp. T6-5 TaxID=1100724 RepID=UPI000D398747|nr:TcpQ domain-containing protein [Limnohabitans sp. T6-5]PUE08661.1 hypothetical protein B9Z51_06840 [Limnohabitans sp. T6-5]